MPVDVSVSHASEQKAGERKTPPGIFISYRRTDTPDAVGRIYDRLVSEFGKSRVFKDVDSIPLGQDFRGHLNDIVGGCAAVLAIIGPKWTDIRNEAGQKRLDDPDDFVRIELEAALARDVPVVPVLVGHAVMPGATQLPASLISLVYRQSIEVRPDPDFHHDATRLVEALRTIIDPHAPAKPAASARAAPNLRRRLSWTTALAAVLGAALIALAIPALKHLQEAPPPETHTDIATPATDYPGSLALSPDGRQIVFVARGDGASRLWLRSLSTNTAQPLPGTEGAIAPFWSPDSRSIAFFARSSLMRLDLEGGQPRVLAPTRNGGWGSWGAKGDILFVGGTADPVMRVSASGGVAVQVTKQLPGDVSHRSPRHLPDDRGYLFTKQGVASGIYLATPDKDEPVRLTTDGQEIAYLPSGWLLWLRAGALSAQRLDLSKSALVGEPLTIAEDIAGVTASASGLIAYRVNGSDMRQVTWVDRTGTVLGTVSGEDATILAPRVSADGRQVAYSRQVQGKDELWVHDNARTLRVTPGKEFSSFPLFSPDGKRLVFSSSVDSAGVDLMQKQINSALPAEQLLAAEGIAFASSWSGDGHYLMYFRFGGGTTGGDIWVKPMSGERKPFPFANSNAVEVWGQFSPDGKWVAYQSNSSGQDEIYLRAFADAGASEEFVQVSTAGGVHPQWRADGKELYYIDPAGMMMATPIKSIGSSLAPGAPQPLFQTRVLGGGFDSAQGRQYDVAPDGRFLINRLVDADAPPITLIQNWNPDAGK